MEKYNGFGLGEVDRVDDSLIEYYFSTIIKKYVVRTKKIKLTGVGITRQHSEDTTGKYNTYSLTKKAFDKVFAQYENQIEHFG